jgi:hypothetical protein
MMFGDDSGKSKELCKVCAWICLLENEAFELKNFISSQKAKCRI